MSLRHVILFIAIVFFVKGSNAQFILAGEHNPNNYYVSKDTVINVYYSDSTNYSIDVNGDGVIDCIIKISAFMGINYHVNNYDILPQNASQVAWFTADTCFDSTTVVTVSNLAKNFPKNDSINKTAIWKNSELILAYASGSAHGGGRPYCAAAEFNWPDTGFVGIRVFAGKDTVYGWIRIAWYNGPLLMLEVIDYASNAPLIELPEKLTVYPIPSAGVFTFRSSRLTPQTAVKVYNIFGQMVYYSQLSTTNSEYTINLSGEAAGMYFYKVISGTGDALANGKLIVK